MTDAIWREFNARIDAEGFKNERQTRLAMIAAARAYFNGDHKRPLKVKQGERDHNVIINMCRSLVNKSVGWLFGDPDDGKMLKMEIEKPTDDGEAVTDEEATPKPAVLNPEVAQVEPPAERKSEAYLEAVWKKNGGVRLLQRMGRSGGIAGHVFVKVMPKDDPANNLGVPRIVLQPSDLITVLTRPDDRETAEAFVIEWIVFREVRGEMREVRVRQIIALLAGDTETEGMKGQWWIGTFNDSGEADGEKRWVVEVEPAAWPNPWPPVIDWQNLPSDDGYYGQSDLEDLTGLNDGVNFVASNINKIVYYHGHPRTIGTGFDAGELKDTAVDAFWTIKDKDAKVNNLEMKGDLQSSYMFLNFLRESFWDIGRGLDISTLRDRIGQLTNFGLKVLANEALSKLSDKRLTYGDGIQRINKVLLMLEGLAPDDTKLHWKNPLPSNDSEEVKTLQIERDMGTVSKQTAAEELGRDWPTEQERMDAEGAADGNVGDKLLKAFERGTQTGLNRPPTATPLAGSENDGLIPTE